MKLCPTCEQAVAEGITTCPSCGGDIGPGRSHIDDYRILEILHEGHASVLFKAEHETGGEQVMIRLFTPQSGVNQEIAERLELELGKLQALPDRGFVRHQAIHRSSDGLWYRVSEWINAESWGSLLASGQLDDLGVKLDLFRQIASAIGVLHRQGHIIPHLILNDIMVVRDDAGRLEARIDYKLSRFLDPRMTRPGPMLKQLLGCHPDIVNQRPLDARSDMWSLGKVFVEILAGDLVITNPEETVDNLSIPEDLKVLLRVMLADDPDLRPQSMEEIAEAVARAGKTAPAPADSQPASATPPGTRRRRGRLPYVALVVVVVGIVGMLAWYMGRRFSDVDRSLEEHANRYAPSIAFVMVDYRLEVEGETIYRNAAEGTAFLVDAEGHLLTSRHVICPWLEDGHLLNEAFTRFRNGVIPKLEYSAYLWFEGQKAFNRAGNLLDSPDISDFFFTGNAYSTAGPDRLTIDGVALPPVRTRQLINSPLKDDIAVLRVDPPPAGLAPLPLDAAFDPNDVKRLASVIALGFPLGSRIQEDTVRVSAVDGHVRRSFRNVLQIDSSLHGGNSGGPLIDAGGKVIGIVSAVAMTVDRNGGMFATSRPLGDIGLILPITSAADLLAEIRAGGAKWNGVLDFTIDGTLREIREKATRGRWIEARALANAKLEGNLQAELLTASGMMAFCGGDLPAARHRFSQLLSMDPDAGQAKLMILILDWLDGNAAANPHLQELTAADWRSPLEFEGYLARILNSDIPLDSGLAAWNNRAERSWLNFVGGLRQDRAGNSGEAEELLRQSILATESDAWVYYLATASLDRLWKRDRADLRSEDQWSAYRAARSAFRAAREKARDGMTEREERLVPILTGLQAEGLDIQQRLQLLEQLYRLEPDDFYVRAALAFYNTAAENWQVALEHVTACLKRDSRPTVSVMSLGLLEAGILRFQGSDSEADNRLEAYDDVVRDPLFLAVADIMAGRSDADSIKSEIEERPEDLLIANMLIGFWSEAAGDREQALFHYKEALGSFLDDWVEYDFARERIKRLRQPPQETN